LTTEAVFQRCSNWQQDLCLHWRKKQSIRN